MSARTRAAAARGIARVIEGGSLNDLLPAILADLADPADRGLLQELVYGTLRYAPRLEFLLTQLLDRPVRKREPRVHALLLVGLYQILYTRVPPHAAVAETVEAARVMRKQWAAGLTNAVLRRFQREQEALLAKADAHRVGRSAHPDWLLDLLEDAWPDDVEAIVAANNDRGPMSLRVNSRRGTRDAYLERLEEAGLAATSHPLAGDAIVLDSPCDVNELPGFIDGDVSVQDVAAQLAADVMDPQPGETILDACAAPGGKTAHLAERCPELERLVAIDKDERRLDRVAENLARLDLAAAMFAADAARPEEWWNDEPFDRILLDAPCSATGVIRRHPDIKLLRKKRDIEALASLQSRLLDRLWPLLARGGRLVYATCSVLPRENSQQVANFLDRHDDAVALPLAVEWGRPSGFGRQVLTGEQGMDGFFYAVLSKA
ncbi:MAG: 16S rRNA (cytosine(967)-C(5))-methyltransferase RsmB [Gammaproteobacteria bacterium]|nr:16S rRNA (cytosine(967)-C(5))-methyltransferase RsmB [Gammaproteobacteria bacterium]